MKMNRRGDIPVTVLVIAVVFLCGLALISFFNANLKMKNSFVGVNVMKEINSRIEQNVFEGKNIIGIYNEKKVTRWVRLRRIEKVIFSAEVLS